MHLDLVGHIPAWNEIDRFHRDKNPAKRAALVDKLLDSPGYVRNWTTIWTNLTIGRKTVRLVSRTGMERFFREAFAQNRPWNEVVRDLVAAEGRSDENGAVNYLLAQMTTNDEAVQATAKTTRLFMGIQVQCTQCHNHPFNEWKQDQFWQINSFLRQTRRLDHRKFDPATGRQVDDYAELVPSNFSGPVFFEKRSGEMQVAYPIFFDTKVDPGSEMNRRKELARLMTSGENPLIARAMVNRTWAHFLGYGFTTPGGRHGTAQAPLAPGAAGPALAGVRQERLRSQAADPLDLRLRSVQPHEPRRQEERRGRSGPRPCARSSAGCIPSPSRPSNFTIRF